MWTVGREREKQHAARHIRNKDQLPLIEAVIDTLHDFLEDSSKTEALTNSIRRAFLEGGSGIWEGAGTWLCKLHLESTDFDPLWHELAGHKSARIRRRVAGFVGDLPKTIQLDVAKRLLHDRSAHVRGMTAGNISWIKSGPAVEVLWDRLSVEEVEDVRASIEYSIQEIRSGAKS